MEKLYIKKSFKYGFILALLSGLTNLCHAATINWTGSTSSDWNTTSNWSTNQVPTAADVVQIGVVAFTNTNQPTLNENHTCSSIFIGNASGAVTLTIKPNVTLSTSGTAGTITFTVNTSANLTVANTGTLNIVGDFYNNGTITFGLNPINISGNFTDDVNGSITFGTGLVTFASTASGNSTVTMKPNATLTFINVLFTGNLTYLFKTSNGATANFAVASTGTLTLAGTKTKLNFANVTSTQGLTLYSDASGSASVAPIPTGCYILSNKIVVQRFITGNGSNIYRGYRLLSSPVNITSETPSLTNYISLSYINATVGGVNGAFTGGPGTGFSVKNGNPSIYLYKETLPVNNNYYISGKHIGIDSITGNTVTTVSNATGPTIYTSGVNIPVGNGYLFYFVGPNNRTSGSSSIPPINTTISASGFLNQGDITVNLWYTPTGGPGYLSYTSSLGASGAGYNMVGNPYACTIDLSKVLNDNIGIDNIYLLSAIGPSQSYQVYTTYGNSSPSGYYAVSGQGMIVHATSASSKLTFHESEKAATVQLTGTNLLMGTPKQEAALTGLYLKLEQDSLHYDYTGIYFGNNWSDAFEGGDANYLYGNSINMASLSSDGITAAVNHLHTYTNDNRVHLYTNAKSDGAYTLKIEGIRNIDTTYDIYLVDHYKQDSVNIRKTGAYTFSILKSDTASFGANRFVLAFHRNPAYLYKLLSFTAQEVAHSPHVLLTWKTQNELNNNFTVERSNNGGSTFTFVGGLAGTGAGAYGLTDKNAIDGQNLYRLKSEDVNNNLTYSQIVEVMISGKDNADKIRLYPNPATSIVNLDMLDKPNGNSSYSITVSNNTGLIVKQVTSSQTRWQTDVSNLMPGTYLVRVINTKTQSLVGESKFVKL